MEKTNIMDKTKNIKYIYFDLDGTFLKSKTPTNQKDDICHSSLEALKILRNKGIKYGIATGRPIDLFWDVVEKMNSDLPVITINGNLIFDFKKNINHSVKALGKKQKKAFVDYAKKNQLNYLAYSDDGIYHKLYSKSGHMHWIYNSQKHKVKKHQARIFEFKDINIPVYKFLVLTHESTQEQIDHLKDFMKNIEGVYLMLSQKNLFDIMPSGVNKGSGLQLLANLGYINLDQTMVIGDSYNDLDMFKQAKVSVAMANAYPEVKQKADYVTKFSNDDQGILKFLNEIF